MRAVLLALAGAVVSILAFPPFGPGWLIIVGVTLFMTGLRLAPNTRAGFLVGALYGMVFFAGLLWWLAELELIALVLVPVEAAFFALYGWWLTRFNERSATLWLVLAVGGWALIELGRYRFPVGGFEWGAAGYALSDSLLLRLPAATVGTSGLTLLIVMLSGIAACAATKAFDRRMLWSLPIVFTVIAATTPAIINRVDSGPLEVAIVQGSTPCPFQHCPPDERLRTFQQHLELTRQIEAGSVDLVVWSEGSTGSTNADPVLNEEVRDAIGAEARRIGAAMLVGGDRVVSDTEWINANVYFDADGDIVGEYRKRHAVPFGEYIPLRPIFEWIPALDQVPRDMIPGHGPIVFPGGVGSVISFEGGFSRYALDTRRAGAKVLVVATNEASYGPDAATSDQFIGMTRMRAVELGIPVIHAAVTGRSAVIDYQGGIDTRTDLGTEEILYGAYGLSTSTIYTVTGDLLMYLAPVLGLAVWWRSRSLVGSVSRASEED